MSEKKFDAQKLIGKFVNVKITNVNNNLDLCGELVVAPKKCNKKTTIKKDTVKKTTKVSKK